MIEYLKNLLPFIEAEERICVFIWGRNHYTQWSLSYDIVGETILIAQGYDVGPVIVN